MKINLYYGKVLKFQNYFRNSFGFFEKYLPLIQSNHVRFEIPFFYFSPDKDICLDLSGNYSWMGHCCHWNGVECVSNTRKGRQAILLATLVTGFIGGLISGTLSHEDLKGIHADLKNLKKRQDLVVGHLEIIDNDIAKIDSNMNKLATRLYTDEKKEEQDMQILMEYNVSYFFEFVFFVQLF